MSFAKLIDAKKIIYRLSEPSKMPGFSWGIDPKHCITGSVLKAIEGTPCHDCYADNRGRYSFGVVKNAMLQRLRGFDDPKWVDAMVFSLSSHRVKSTGYFRWFDAGDVQSLKMLNDICTIATRTPFLKHWLPTREYKIVRECFKDGKEPPKNLTIRMSAPMIDGNPPPWWRWTSNVYDTKKPLGSPCPAHEQGNQCAECRNCWDRRIPNISYPLH